MLCLSQGKPGATNGLLNTDEASQKQHMKGQGHKDATAAYERAEKFRSLYAEERKADALLETAVDALNAAESAVRSASSAQMQAAAQEHADALAVKDTAMCGSPLAGNAAPS